MYSTENTVEHVHMSNTVSLTIILLLFIHKLLADEEKDVVPF